MTGIQVHPTAYGPAAASTLHGIVAAAKARDALRPVTVVVPTNSVGVATRRALASEALGPVTDRGRGIAGLQVLTIYRLAELLGAPALAAAGRRPVSTPVVAAAVRGVLADEAGVFAEVVDHPATEASLVDAHRELSDCTAGTLDALAATGPRARDVVRVHRAVRQRLADRWYDEADLMGAAHDAVLGRAPVLDDVGEVVLHLPQVLSPAAARLVRALSDHTRVHVVAGLTGVESADADVRRTLARLGATTTDAEVPAPLPVHGVVSVSDAEEEVRTAVQQVLDAMRSDGTPAERIAVVHPAPEPYAPILAQHLAAAGIPWNGPSDRRSRQRFAARWLLDVLELSGRRWGRAAVINVLAGPDRGRIRDLPMSVHQAEAVSRDAGVTQDIEAWIQRLTRYADEQRDRARRAEGEGGPDWLADRCRQQADRADALRGVVVGLAADLEAGAGLTRWADLAEWARDLLHRRVGRESDRLDWPVEETRAADAVEAALDRVAALDEVERSADLARLHRTLELELDRGLERTGALGAGVLVGRPADTLGVDLDLVVVLGLAEGVFPTRPREDSLLAEHERATVADELPPRVRSIDTQHRHLLAALASARRRVLVHPRGDLRRSIERAPSRWLLDAVEATTGQRRLDGADDLVTVVASFADRVATTDVPGDDQALHLRALAADDTADPAPSWLPAFASGRRLLHARAGDAFTPFDGNLADVADLVPVPGVAAPTSPTRLEDWVACPHGSLVRTVLRVKPVEEPEDRLEITPLAYGSLFHRVLEDWIGEHLEQGMPDPGTPWSDASRRRLHEVADRHVQWWAEAGLTGHPRLWDVKREQLHRLLDAFVDDDDRVRAERRSTPVATELGFGPDHQHPALAVDLGDGRTVTLQGVIDRVDRTADGGVVVTDYKTGSATGYRDLSEEEPAADGTRLQLLVYGLAARQVYPDAPRVHAEYLFAGPKDTGRRVGYDVGDHGREALVEVVRLVVDHVGAGVFPQRPPEPTYHHYTPCLYCDPDELGTADRYRAWERLRLTPELRDYVRRVEPDVLEAVDA